MGAASAEVFAAAASAEVSMGAASAEVFAAAASAEVFAVTASVPVSALASGTALIIMATGATRGSHMTGVAVTLTPTSVREDHGRWPTWQKAQQPTLFRLVRVEAAVGRARVDAAHSDTPRPLLAGFAKLRKLLSRSKPHFHLPPQPVTQVIPMQAERIGQGRFPLFAVQRDADVGDSR
jgi:hypothetical protein